MYEGFEGIVVFFTVTKCVRRVGVGDLTLSVEQVNEWALDSIDQVSQSNWENHIFNLDSRGLFVFARVCLSDCLMTLELNQL